MAAFTFLMGLGAMLVIRTCVSKVLPDTPGLSVALCMVAAAIWGIATISRSGWRNELGTSYGAGASYGLVTGILIAIIYCL